MDKFERMNDQELTEALAELLGWYWDDDWGCLVPPQQKAKPWEMWTDWIPGYDEKGYPIVFRKIIKGTHLSGISYNGNSTKVILPEWVTSCDAAAEVEAEIARRGLNEQYGKELRQIIGLEHCEWPGRRSIQLQYYQTVSTKEITKIATADPRSQCIAAARTFSKMETNE